MQTLDQLGIKHQTDKSTAHHGYLPIYEQYLSKWRDKPITLIEAGIGGYEYADRGGQSARMWREYFPHATIVTFDIHRKMPIHGVDVLQGSQDDPLFIASLPECELFIDDASHINPLTIETFRLAWPKVKLGGLYIVEDVHTSYWPDHGYQGCSDVFTLNAHTTMNEFLFMAHFLNREHIKWDRDPVPFDKIPDNIAFIHFYPKLILIGKK